MALRAHKRLDVAATVFFTTSCRQRTKNAHRRYW
jgi:hypothetical protein